MLCDRCIFKTSGYLMLLLYSAFLSSSGFVLRNGCRFWLIQLCPRLRPPAVSCMYEQASVKTLVTRVLGDPSLMLKRFSRFQRISSGAFQSIFSDFLQSHQVFPHFCLIWIRTFITPFTMFHWRKNRSFCQDNNFFFLVNFVRQLLL